MIEVFLEPFEHAFLQRALIGGSLAAIGAAVVGTWVVVRGMTFLGDALAHGVLPGIALAIVVGVDPTIGAAVSAAAMVGLMTLIRRAAPLGDDAVIGLLFVGMLATGVVIVSKSGSFTADLTAVLFGDVLGVSSDDLWILGGAALVAVGGTALLWRPLLALSLDATRAATLGMRPAATHAALLTLVSLVVVTSFRAVGALLVFGLLVGPAATAMLITRRLRSTVAVAAAIGVASVYVGLVISFQADTAGGATIAATTVAAFLVTLAGRVLADALSGPPAAATA